MTFNETICEHEWGYMHRSPLEGCWYWELDICNKCGDRRQPDGGRMFLVKDDWFYKVKHDLVTNGKYRWGDKMLKEYSDEMEGEVNRLMDKFSLSRKKIIIVAVLLFLIFRLLKKRSQ